MQGRRLLRYLELDDVGLQTRAGGNFLHLFLGPARNDRIDHVDDALSARRHVIAAEHELVAAGRASNGAHAHQLEPAFTAEVEQLLGLGDLERQTAGPVDDVVPATHPRLVAPARQEWDPRGPDR